MESKDLVLYIAKCLSDKKAFDITMIDIAERSGFADYFVLATASSLRQMGSLTDDLEDKLAEQGRIVKNVEGRGESGWILMDYEDVIINIFTEEARNKYQIEKVWGDCQLIDYKEEQ